MFKILNERLCLKDVDVERHLYNIIIIFFLCASPTRSNCRRISLS